jgi:hypothetical protein
MIATIAKGLAWLLVLAFMGVLGLVTIAGEAARPYFIKDTLPHDEDEVSAARAARRRRDFDGVTELE